MNMKRSLRGWLLMILLAGSWGYVAQNSLSLVFIGAATVGAYFRLVGLLDD